MIFSKRNLKIEALFITQIKKWKLSRTLNISVLFLVSMEKNVECMKDITTRAQRAMFFYFKKIKSFKLANSHRPTINFIW